MPSPFRPPLSADPAPRATPLALTAAALGALACGWIAWCEFPFYWWNDVRLVPAFAFRDGLNPYPPLGGGPLLTWIYGPVGFLLNLPATLASTPLGALHVASIINAFVLLAPLAAIFFSSAELRRRGVATCGLALALAILLVPRTDLVIQVADHCAIAAGLMANWCLATQPDLTPRRLVLAAAWAALAVWSKQLAVFLFVAQFAFLARQGPPGAARRYLGWFVVFNLAVLAACAAKFGLPNLWLNLVDIPGRLPWAPFQPHLLMRWRELVAQVALPVLGLLVLWRTRLWPRDDLPSSRFFRLAVLSTVTTLPIGLLAYFKIGGDMNLLYGWHNLMPAALLAWLARDRASAAAGWRQLAVAAAVLAFHARDFATLPARPFTGAIEVAEQLARLYSHSAWFPQNPLITYYADGRLWHSEDGILTRHLAGYGLREPDFRRHVPPTPRAVVYPSANTARFALQLLPQFDQLSRFPYWNVYQPSSAVPARQRTDPSPK